MLKAYPFFVYGTLRPGQGNYYALLEGATTTEEDGFIRGYQMVTNGGFPYVIHTGDPDDVVYGTIIEVPQKLYEQVQRRLDRLEGTATGSEPSIHNHYNRQLETVYFDGGNILCWLYVPSRPEYVGGLKRVESGDWCRR